MIILSAELMRFIIYVENVQQCMRASLPCIPIHRYTRTIYKIVHIFNEYIDKTLTFMVFAIDDYFVAVLIYLITRKNFSIGQFWHVLDC